MLAARFPETQTFLDTRPDEADIFNRLKSSKIYTRMFEAKGLPRHHISQFVSLLTSSPEDSAGVYYLRRDLGIYYPNLTEPVDVYVSGQQVGFKYRDKISDRQVDQQLMKDLKGMGATKIKVLDKFSPEYFARFSNSVSYSILVSVLLFFLRGG